MSETPVLGPVGPAQSEELMHFTSRGGTSSDHLPPEIASMTPEQRLDTVIATRELRAFPVFGTGQRRCLCFSESPLEHLAHLITRCGFQPWGIAVTRTQMIRLGGGAVAYVPDEVRRQFRRAGLEHWAVRTGSDSTWLHEREWRLPLAGEQERARLSRAAAILIGDPGWRPTSAGTGRWFDHARGEHLPGPNGNPECEEITELPELWRTSPIWVWDAARQVVVPHPPGALA